VNNHVIWSSEVGIVLEFFTRKGFWNPMYCSLLVALFSKVVGRNSVSMFVSSLCPNGEGEEVRNNLMHCSVWVCVM
jgi:hypothetical protein